MPAVPLVRVIRSGFEEAVHLGSVAVAGPDGDLVAFAGEPARPVFARSSMKPLQAAVSLELTGEDLPDPEVAVMCASHAGEPVHVDAVRMVLDRAGLSFDALQCPPARPFDEEAARNVPTPRPEFHNCSGKHAGMLLASVRRGFDMRSYRKPEHPLQQAVLAAVSRTAGREPDAVGVDGCGVPVHALPLLSVAALFASLASGRLPMARRALSAMRAWPYLVAGRSWVCTALMEAAPGVAAKGGAEGLMCAAVVDRGLGVAVKIEDGAARATGPAMIRALALLGALDGPALEGLHDHARPPVLGGGQRVGDLVARFDLQRA